MQTSVLPLLHSWYLLIYPNSTADPAGGCGRDDVYEEGKVRKVAEVVVGFGILFVGLSTMSQAMANMKNEPQVVNLLMSLKNPFLATLMGFALTAIIQSSSVTVSIVLLLANQDLLPLPITLYIILGCNIGACATAMLASMTGKRTQREQH